MLAVDDEPVARQQLVFQIAALGHAVSAAACAAEAQEILTREGSSAFDCLITDCWMPGQTGLDLLLWLKEHDPMLASIVVSQAGDEEVVTQTLRGGASDFLKKPISSDELYSALQRTFESTRRRRRNAANGSAVRQAGLVQRHINNLWMAHDHPCPVTICYHPRHDAGGDSVAIFSLDPSRILVVVADVSGHDLKSAFVSAYFQGMLRAMIQERIPIQSVLENFNRFLIGEWNLPASSVGDPLQEITSLAVCAASIDLNGGTVRLLNSGFPLANLVDRCGHSLSCGEGGGSPLGWIDPNPSVETSVAVTMCDRLVIWTDGVEDLANQLHISKWSLAFGILLANESRSPVPWLNGAPDDVLLVLVQLQKECPDSCPFPILADNYPKNRIEEIDELQGRWRRSLAFAFPDLKPQRLQEILLCTREGVLNGLLHGCAEASDHCRVEMIVDRSQNQLEVAVTDPGPGHNFDHRNQASVESLDGHRGLLMIHYLSQRVERNESGSAIRMFFELERNPKG